ncbi:hypothetical protein ES703_113333 [subsurface metagenome]
MPLDVARRGTLDVKDPPLKAIVAVNDNYEEGYHKGNAGGLDAVDTDLAPGNIKDTVDIFGKVGTFVGGAITHDDQDKAITGTTGWIGDDVDITSIGNVLQASDELLLTVTITCEQATILQAVYFAGCLSPTGSPTNALKVQMYIDGVAQGESGFLPDDDRFHLYSDMGNKAVALGDRVVYLNAHNYDAEDMAAIYIIGGIHGGCTKL